MQTPGSFQLRSSLSDKTRPSSMIGRSCYVVPWKARKRVPHEGFWIFNAFPEASRHVHRARQRGEAYKNPCKWRRIVTSSSSSIRNGTRHFIEYSRWILDGRRCTEMGTQLLDGRRCTERGTQLWDESRCKRRGFNSWIKSRLCVCLMNVLM